MSSIQSVDDMVRSVVEREELVRDAVLEQRCWIVELDGDVVGYGIVSHRFFGRSFLELIYIDEPHRSKGYGPKLMSYLEAFSKSDDLFTSTNESNTHMQHVLEKLGYQQSGIIHNLDPGDPEIVYAKRVTRSLQTK